MNKSIKSQFKVTKVRRVLRLADNGFEPDTYIMYKVSGPRKLVKYFTTKKAATAWVKDFTAQKPLTTENLIDLMRGR
jgi:hypothetical protein